VLDPVTAPDAVFVKPQVGYTIGSPSMGGGFAVEKQDRAEYYASTHLQTIEFEIAREIVRRLVQPQVGGSAKRTASLHQLFPQVFRLVDQYLGRRVDFRGCDPREVGLQHYAQRAVELSWLASSPMTRWASRRCYLTQPTGPSPTPTASTSRP
jgi:type III restriction enzyme